tara:strand:- start:695 stop:1018 length:324 start_codon:yes stop_codon:yes gene_type:complete
MKKTKNSSHNMDEEIGSSMDEDTVIKIDVGVPLPLDIRGRSKYPFDKMEVNDSIFIELTEGITEKVLLNRLSQATRNYGKKQEPEKHFILRIRVENEISGVRIWRID